MSAATTENGVMPHPLKPSARKPRTRKVAVRGRRKPLAAVTVAGTLGKGKVVATEDLEFSSNGRQGTVYQPIIDAVLELEKDQSYIVPLGKCPPEVMRDRLTAPFQKAEIQSKAPSGWMFLKRISKKNQLVVSLVKRTVAK